MSPKKRKIIDKIIHMFLTDEASEECMKKIDERGYLIAPKTIRIIKITVAVLVIVLGIYLVFIGIKRIDNNDKTRNTEVENSITEYTDETRYEKVEYGEPINYLFDTVTNKQVIITPVKVDGKVAYSTRFRNTDTTVDKVSYRGYPIKNDILFILLNGYPYVSNENLEVDNDTEAYASTQLALLEYLVNNNFLEIKNDDLLIKDVVATSSEYKDAVTRIKNSARKQLDHAIEEHSLNYDYFFDTIKNKYKYYEDKGYGLIGPISESVTYPEVIKRLNENVGSNDTLDFIIYDYSPDVSKASIVNENLEEVESVPMGSNYYIKITGKEGKNSSNIIVKYKSEYMRAFTYADDSLTYYFLKPVIYRGVYMRNYALFSGTKHGEVTILFEDKEGNEIYDAGYRILNENGDVVFDNLEADSLHIVDLPLGKYTIEEYKPPKEYLLNSNKYVFELSEDNKEKSVVIKHDSLF